MARNGNTKPTGDVANKDGAVKKKDGRGGYRERNGGALYFGAQSSLLTNPGDSTKIVKLNVELLNLSLDEIDLTSYDAVLARIVEYFEVYAKYDMKPTVAGLCLVLNNIDQRRIRELYSDTPGRMPHIPQDVRGLVKRVYGTLDSLWETYMNSGKINPVAGIFLGKNHFGKTDRQEITFSPGANQEDNFNEDDIRQRYIASPTTIESDFSSDSE